MTIPKANYVVDDQGQKIYVQLSVQDWETFVLEYKQMQSLFSLKNKLKNAFLEVRQLQKGEKKGTTLSDFLDEL